MAYFVFQGWDRPGAEALRERIRPAHRRHLREPFPGCRCLQGGPLVEDDGVRMIGTLLILEADSREAAQGFLARDPYAAEALFAHTRLDRWAWSLGAPVEPTLAERMGNPS